MAQSLKQKYGVPDGARERKLWVQMHLRLRGLSLAQIARDNGWSHQAVVNALHQPSYPQEAAIAAALDAPVEAVFHERYDHTGRRLHPRKKRSNTAAACNVKDAAGV